MKIIKILYRTVAILLFVATFTCMFMNYSEERHSGGYTGANSFMSNSSKQWVIDNFDEYETFDDLLYTGMTPFVLNNFVYDSKYNYRFPLQSFNFEFFQNVKWHGVCFQFAQWAKSVVLEWSNHKGIDVQSYVFDVELKSGGKHSYNFFVYDGNTYCVDFTEALALYDKRFEEYVFVRPDGYIITPTYVSSHFSHLLKKFDMRKVRFHDIRHTTATLLLKQDWSIKHIQEWLRHSDPSTTAKFYVDVDEKERARVGFSLDEKYKLPKKEVAV